MRFVVTIDRDEDGVWVVECPAIPGCVSQGTTKEEALANVEDAIRACLQVQSERGMPLTVETRPTSATLLVARVIPLARVMAAIWQCPKELISNQIHAVRILIRCLRREASKEPNNGLTCSLLQPSSCSPDFR